MLRELEPSETAPVVELIEEPTKSRPPFYAAVTSGLCLCARYRRAFTGRGRRRAQQTLSLLDVAKPPKNKPASRLESAQTAIALQFPLTEARALLEDAEVAKQTHDWKSALHLLAAQGVALRGAAEDTMLLSYALNPTHATQLLADVAARHSQPALDAGGWRGGDSRADARIEGRGEKGGGRARLRGDRPAAAPVLSAWSRPGCA